MPLKLSRPKQLHLVLHFVYEWPVPAYIFAHWSNIGCLPAGRINTQWHLVEAENAISNFENCAFHKSYIYDKFRLLVYCSLVLIYCQFWICNGQRDVMLGLILLRIYQDACNLTPTTQFSVPQIEYPQGGSSKKGSDIYFLLIVAMVLLLWCQIVLLWHQITMVTSEQHLYQTIVLPRKLATGSILDYLFLLLPPSGYSIWGTENTRSFFTKLSVVELQCNKNICTQI